MESLVMTESKQSEPATQSLLLMSSSAAAVEVEHQAGAEEHQGSGQIEPINNSAAVSPSLAMSPSQVGLLIHHGGKKPMSIVRPVLLDQTQQQQAANQPQQQQLLPPKKSSLPPKQQSTTHNNNSKALLSSPQGRRNSKQGSGKGAVAAAPQYGMPQLKKGQLNAAANGKPPYHSSKNSGSVHDTATAEPSQQKKSGQQQSGSKNGIIATQLGIKLKQQPPALPKNFEQSPLFDNGATSQYFRLQPKETQSSLFHKTIKMASEAQLGQDSNAQKTNTNATGALKRPVQNSPKQLKNKLIKEHMQAQSNAKAMQNRKVAQQEQFSVKLTTNKDQFFAFQIETVSDAFTSVELKKVSRDMQKEKRREREAKKAEAQATVSGQEIQFQTQSKQASLKLVVQASSDTFTNPIIYEEAGDKSPYSKSKTRNLDKEEETFDRKAKPPALRKTATMTRQNKHKKKMVSGRNQVKQQLQTDQEHKSNDYGYTSPTTSRNLQALDQKKFQIGHGSVTISEPPQQVREISNNQKRKNTPDSRSYSYNSINSIEDAMRDQLKKSLENKNIESQSSTLDLGQSMTKSKMSIRYDMLLKSSVAPINEQIPAGDDSQPKRTSDMRARKGTVGPSPVVNKQAFTRQRTFGSTSLSPTDRGNSSYAKNHKTLPSQNRRKISDKSLIQNLRVLGTDQRSIHSRTSKISNLEARENREQRIFDVYMKQPYRLMDAGAQKRQMNRQNMKHLQFIQSPSKERLTLDNPLRAAQDYAENKRGSLPSSHQNLFQTLDASSTKKLKTAKQMSAYNNINQQSIDNLKPYESSQNDFNLSKPPQQSNKKQLTSTMMNNMNSTQRSRANKTYSNKLTATMPAGLNRGSPNRSPNFNNNNNNNNNNNATSQFQLSKQNQKQEKINSSVSYLQQVFIQRKQEEQEQHQQQFTSKYTSAKNGPEGAGGPSTLPSLKQNSPNRQTISKLSGKHKSKSITQSNAVKLLNETKKPTGNKTNVESRTRNVSPHPSKDKVSKTGMMGNTHSPSGAMFRDNSSGQIHISPDKERKNSNNNNQAVNQNNNYNQWAEEQKANVADTYLRPFKLMKNGEVVQQPQTKTIKKGRLVGLPGLPGIRPTKDQTLHMLGSDSARGFGRHKKSNSNSMVILDHKSAVKPSGSKILVQTASDDALATMNYNKNNNNHSGSGNGSINNLALIDQHAGQIINLQLGNMDAVHKTMGSRNSSGEFRYNEDVGEYHEQEHLGFTSELPVIQPEASLNGTETHIVNNIMHQTSDVPLRHDHQNSRNHQNHHTVDVKNRSGVVTSLPGSLYPAVYAHKPIHRVRKPEKILPWASRVASNKRQAEQSPLPRDQSNRQYSVSKGGIITQEEQQGPDSMTMTMGANGSNLTSSQYVQGRFKTMASPPLYKKSLSLQRTSNQQNSHHRGHQQINMQRNNNHNNMAAAGVVGSKNNSFAPPRFPASSKNINTPMLQSISQTPEKGGGSNSFLPPTIQTTCAFSPDFPQVVKRDTRPAFLGGQYTSKVKGVSEVSQYINHGLHTRLNATEFISNSGLANNDVENGDASATYDVQSYYKQKLRMRNSIERVFANQVNQYHHDKKAPMAAQGNYNSAGQRASATNQSQLQSQGADQGDLELPEISATGKKTQPVADQQLQQQLLKSQATL